MVLTQLYDIKWLEIPLDVLRSCRLSSVISCIWRRVGWRDSWEVFPTNSCEAVGVDFYSFHFSAPKIWNQYVIAIISYYLMYIGYWRAEMRAPPLGSPLIVSRINFSHLLWSDLSENHSASISHSVSYHSGISVRCWTNSNKHYMWLLPLLKPMKNISPTTPNSIIRDTTYNISKLFMVILLQNFTLLFNFILFIIFYILYFIVHLIIIINATTTLLCLVLRITIYIF